MEDVVDLERLCIRLDQCVTVIPGGIDSRTLHALEEHGYDQAPVYDVSTHRYWRLVQTEYLRSLLKLGQPLLQDNPVIRDEKHEFHVGSFVTIFDLLERMAVQRAVIVIRDSDATEYGPVEFIWGLFTTSDLNRQAVRSAIYHCPGVRGAEGQGKRKGVTARWGLKDAWNEHAGGGTRTG